MTVAENIRRYKELIPPGIELVAVSKFHPSEMIMEAYNAGQTTFGESRVQEFVEKYDKLPKDIRWHFIGHLQTNKLKQIIGKTTLIESVDSQRLIELINNESEKAGVKTDVLLQVHVAEEEAKFGFFPQELIEYLSLENFRNLTGVRICGLMAMATNTDDEERIRQDFRKMNTLFKEVKEKFFNEDSNFRYLSMGMSGDWEIAIEEGSNIVRIGSSIFGARY